jgi:hypothetical protein
VIKIRGFSTQLVCGLWLGFAAFAGIVTRSWASLMSIAALFGAFLCPSICLWMLKRQHRWARRVGALGLAAFAGAILLGIALTIERLYFVNADSYPEFMATRLKGDASDAEVLKAANCVPMEILEKENGWLIRCGLLRINGPVFLTSKFPFSN